jgi:hypothetical protein
MLPIPSEEFTRGLPVISVAFARELLSIPLKKVKFKIKSHKARDVLKIC